MKKNFLQFLLISIVCTALPLSVDAKKVKYNSHLYYEGEVTKGKPSGNGILYCTLDKVDNFGSGFMKFITDPNYNPLSDKKAKDGVCDVIKGTFSGNQVTDATVAFNSGWGYEGDIIFDASDDKLLTLSFVDGVFTVPASYTGSIFNEIRIVDTCYMVRRYEDFAMKTSKIKVHPSGIKISNRLGEIPTSFIRYKGFVVNVELSQNIINKKEEWEINYYKTDVYQSEDKNSFLKVFDNISNGSPRIIYYSQNEPITYYDSKGPYLFHLNDGDVMRDSTLQCTISYKDGSTFKGKTQFKGKDGNGLSEAVSFDPYSKYYIGNYEINTSIESSIAPYTGLLSYKDGRSVKYTEGLTEEELKAKRLLAAKKEEERLLQLKKAEEERRAQQIADQKKEVEAKRVAQAFIKSAWGKTFTFKKNRMFQQVSNGEYSVKFMKNRQDIFVRVNGHLEWLKFVEYSSNGIDLVCRIWNNHTITGTVYISPMKHEGKWALKFSFIDGLGTTYYLYN